MKTALGRGIEALLPRTGMEAVELEIERVIASKQQPRKRFAEGALKELAASISEKGVLQPLIVSANGDGTFTLIAGERRLRAAKLAGLKRVPAVLRKLSSAPEDALEVALIENIQREDLNPIETALALERLQREFSLTHEALSARLGMERTSVTNHLRLLKLHEDVRALVAEGTLSMGHAKVILALESQSHQVGAARKAVDEGFSVRQLEDFLKKFPSAGPGKKPARKTLPETLKDPNIADLEDKLVKSLGTKVRVRHRGKKGGSIEIEYYSLEQLQGILDKII
ncbi:MAG: ParB/RepB/Spo0J family partition protein [Nitrospiraceae bacterium]|nr:ParB/RepB/Spo0J family partition protein [Nitrospiraceae bacterium]